MKGFPLCLMFVSPEFVKILLKKEKSGCGLVKALIIPKCLCQLKSNWIHRSLRPISAGQKSLSSFKYKHYRHLEYILFLHESPLPTLQLRRLLNTNNFKAFYYFSCYPVVTNGLLTELKQV